MTSATIPPPVASVPVGGVIDWPGPVVPRFWLASFGQSLLRASYSALFSALVKTVNTFTVTLASPGVFTTPAVHGLVIGDPVFLIGGTLPTGLTANTTYYVMTVPTTTTFTLGTTRTINVITGGVTVTTAINTSGSQSGTHNLYYAPYEVADSTHFYLPDYRGRTGIAIDNMGGSDSGTITWDNVLGIRAGEGTHTLIRAETPSFVIAAAGGAAGGAFAFLENLTGASFNVTGGGDGAHNTIQPSIAVTKIIYAGVP